MKYLKLLILSSLLFLVNTFADAQTKTDWKEKDQFHTVMSQTFHPAEEGNFKPIRARIDEMLAKAQAWQKSSIPSAFKNQKDIKWQLDNLVKGTQALQIKMRQGLKDEVLKSELTALHDVFHAIIGLCKE